MTFSGDVPRRQRGFANGSGTRRAPSSKSGFGPALNPLGSFSHLLVESPSVFLCNFPHPPLVCCGNSLESIELSKRRRTGPKNGKGPTGSNPEHQLRRTGIMVKQVLEGHTALGRTKRTRIVVILTCLFLCGASLIDLEAKPE